ncbi:hypothetical protein [Lachnoclostridium sp.]|uniref:hypothetical protein n=1 Tax=Lachnoclostridium sp. TaxID=2028282 RepID=UPI0028999A8B|nr:hypothetical protein [Lachnoclostridium sp.]
MNRYDKKMNSVPKVLVISGNCFSTQKNNGKTLGNIFKNWPKEKLAQLYIYPEFPNSNVCNNYFRITDTESLKSLLKHNEKCGGVVQLRHEQEDNTKAIVYKSNWKNWHISRFAREFIWIGVHWKDGLLNWVNDFKPDIVFYVGSNYAFLSRMVDSICKARKIPLIIYCTDDYILPRFTIMPFFHIHRIWIVFWLKKLLNNNKSKLMTINEFMQETYKLYLHKDSKILMNMIDIPLQCPEYRQKDNIISILYIGNLGLNRWKTLGKFADLMSKSQYCNNFCVEVYSGIEPKKDELKYITQTSCMTYKGSLNKEQVKQKQMEADILLHVEAFDYNSRKNVKLSLSTKITEYMSAGKPILAIGPKEVASIKFLQKYGGANCITKLDKKNIHKVLSNMIEFNNRKNMGITNWESINRIINLNNMDEIIKQSINELIN